MRLLPEDRAQGWTRYVWLVYVVFMFVQPALSGRALDWVLTSLAVALFLPLYFAGYWLCGRRLLPVMAAIVVLGLVFAPLNAGAACFFIYGAGFAGRAGRPAAAVRYVAVVVVLVALEAWLIGIPGYSWVWGILFSIIVGGINIHFAEASRNQAKLRLAHEEVERLATAAERERIARDLHDVLGHTLSLITIKAGLAARLAASDAGRAEREMRDVEEISRTALGEVRHAVQGYRFLGLGAELTKAKVALAAAGVELEVVSGPYDLSAEAESAVALALREAVTNVVRHARAHSCSVTYRQTAGEFRLEVVDDGRGGSAPEGNGLAGMRERIEGLGGSVAREVGRGTRLEVMLPLDRSAPTGSRATA
jgi:two-component system, NarL family, sensor histidine kinase DesK